MTHIPGEHPRKPEWSRYRCGVCEELFWGPHLTPEGLHQCAGCRRVGGSLHFTTGGPNPAETADREYHGDLFERGEW